MSKTYRCKGFEKTRTSSWESRGFKTAGHYTEQEGYWGFSYGGDGKTFRPMTKEERWHRDRWFHGESSSAQSRTPGWTYRNPRQRQNRAINRQEIIRYIKADGEYEVMCEANPRDCHWDWS